MMVLCRNFFNENVAIIMHRISIIYDNNTLRSELVHSFGVHPDKQLLM